MLTLGGVLTLAAAQPPQKTEKVPPFLEEFQTGKPRDLPLFLDDFYARTDPPIRSEDVWLPARFALDEFPGVWTRPERKEPLPAILLAYGDEKIGQWMKTNARHFASIGYAVLMVRLDLEGILGDLAGLSNKVPQAQLSTCMHWLRSRGDVLPNRLGVVSFGRRAGRQTLLFASSRSVQACVICDSFLDSDLNVIRGLRGTPVLLVHGADDIYVAGKSQVSEFTARLTAERIPYKVYAARKAQAGFLGPPDRKSYNHDAAEDAWVAIYNFLEKYVEDAKPAETVARPAKSALTISDMMRAVNDPSGVRGTLSKALETQPKTAREWSKVRAHAALIAELGTWLQTQTPPKGPAGHWQEQAQAFTAAAAAIVDAAERRDHALAQRRLADLAGKCAACHNEHR